MSAADSSHFNHNPSSDDHDKGAPSSSNNGRGLVQNLDQLPESNITPPVAPGSSHAVISAENSPPTTISATNNVVDDGFSPTVPTSSDQANRISTTAAPVLEIKEGKNPSQIEQNLLSSVSVKNITGFVSKGFNAAKDYLEDSSVKTLARILAESVETAAANSFPFNYNLSSDDNDKGAPSSSNNRRGLAVISAENPPPTTTSATVPTSSDQANRISTTAATSPSDAVMSTEIPPSTSTTTINGSSSTVMSTERPPPTSATTLSTVSTLPDQAKMIITAANNFKAALAAVNEDNMDSYLDLLTEHIARLFEIKEGKNPSQIEQHLPSSDSVKKIKDIFSEAINGVVRIKLAA